MKTLEEEDTLQRFFHLLIHELDDEENVSITSKEMYSFIEKAKKAEFALSKHVKYVIQISGTSHFHTDTNTGGHSLLWVACEPSVPNCATRIKYSDKKDDEGKLLDTEKLYKLKLCDLEHRGPTQAEITDARGKVVDRCLITADEIEVGDFELIKAHMATNSK